MATRVQNRRGSTVEHSTFTGAVGEVTVDTDKEVVVVHDGTTAGGHPQMRENGSQNLVTTGSVTGGRFIPTSSTVPTNGVYLPAANSVAISTAGSGRLFVDASGNVGVGVSPSAIFEAAGSEPVFGLNHHVTQYLTSTKAYNATPGGGIALRYKYNSANDYTYGAGISFEKDNTADGDFGSHVTLQTRPNAGSATERLRITSAGLVGVGTSSPGSELEVAGDIRCSGSYSTSASNFIFSYGGGAVGAVRSGFYLDGTNTVLGFYTDQAERARIDSSGRLLVGTSTTAAAATELLQVQGVADNTAAGGAISLRRASVGNTDQIGIIHFKNASEGAAHASISAICDGTPSAGDFPGALLFSTTADGASSPTERMRISQTGQVNISHGAVGADVLVANHTSGSFASAIFSLGTTRAAGTACLFIYAAANGANTFNVFNNGNVTNTNNSYGAISDIKLKENIVDANSQWDDLKALQVRNYNFKEGQTHTQIGLVAQEVELVSPGLVSESPDRDEEGNDLGTVTKSVNYSVLYMKAVKALQEAMERIEQLETEMAVVKAQLS